MQHAVALSLSPANDEGALLAAHGAVVPGYRLEARLGGGGFGVVYQARAERSGRVVAVKLLRDDHGRERFQREIRILVEQRKNPHVVDVLGFHEGAPVPYVLLELCAGGSLRSALRERGRCSWRTAATIVSHVTTGLLGVHRAGGFHRDLKPENLLVAVHPVTGRRIVKVADFGLAAVPALTRLAPGERMTRSGRGTPGYIAPEVVAGGAVTAAADVWALGVVGLELLGHPVAKPRTGGARDLWTLLHAMSGVAPSSRPTLGEVRRALAALPAPAAAKGK